MKMIWGMTLEPGKLYTEIMGEEVQLSMAAIDSRKDLGEASNSNSFCQIVMKTSKGEYVLCTLIHGVMFQQSLDLKLMPREKVTFSVQGPSVVYLVGYTASYPEDEELDLEEDVEAGDDSSAWEAFDTDDQSIDQVKQETVEIEADDEDEVHTVTTEEFVAEAEGDGAEQNQVDPEQDNMEDDLQKEGEEEMIFSVADLEPTEIKSEAPTPKPDSPSASSQQVMVSQVTPEDDLFNIQSTDGGMPLPEADANADFFYPETQQQPDVPVTPVSFQPSNTPADFQQHNPQGVLPSESFMPPQKTFVQRTQPSPQRRGNMQQLNTQRTYPPQRRQYGTNRNQPASKTRLQQQRQPVNVQQVRNISNIQQQQQSIPGTSQQDMPGPSTSGTSSTTSVVPANIRDVAAPQSVVLSNTASSSSYHRNIKTRVGRPSLGFKKLFPCRFCSKQFPFRSYLIRHERAHTGERPFQCTTCGKGFSREWIRKSHARCCRK